MLAFPGTFREGEARRRPLQHAVLSSCPLESALMLRPLRFVAPIAAVLSVISNMPGRTLSQPVETMPLQSETKIALGDVRDRIDHMAIDPGRQRLFVAELGNNTVSVVDLKERKVLRRISGLKEPQGVGYVASTDTLYVANAGDGSLRLFRGENYAEETRINLGDDADNVRVDDAASRVIVGFGSGALAVVDAVSGSKIADIPLKSHPESFQLSRDGKEIFVNVPNAREIAVIDRGMGKQVASWPMRSATGNFPMALDEDAGQVFTVFRYPAKLGVFALPDGKSAAAPDACRDAD